MTLAIAWFCSKVSDDDIIVISFFFIRSIAQKSARRRPAVALFGEQCRLSLASVAFSSIVP